MSKQQPPQYKCHNILLYRSSINSYRCAHTDTYGQIISWPHGSPGLVFNGYGGLVPKRQSGRGVKLTAHIHVVPRLRMSGGITPLSHKPSWRGQGLIYSNKTRNPATAYFKYPCRSQSIPLASATVDFQFISTYVLAQIKCHFCSPHCTHSHQLNVNKNPTRCNSMQIFIYCKVTLHVSGVTAPIIRSIKNCNRSLRYRS